MEDSTLKKYFEDFTEKIEELKRDVRDIDIWNRSQYRRLIVLEEKQKQIEAKIQEDKKDMQWKITVITPIVTVILVSIVSLFSFLVQNST